MLHILNNKISLFLLAKLLLVTFFSVNLYAQKGAEKIIIKVGDKTITKTEYLNRAELTPRPEYCKSDNYIHRKIVLNTLIAEKLLAIEAGDDNELTNSIEFENYITGRKEQAMRQVHFYEKAYLKSKPDSTIIAKVYELAGRTYNISYIRLNDSNLASNLYLELSNPSIDFDSVFKSVTSLDTIPTRYVNYSNQEFSLVHKALFSEPIEKGQVLPPLFVEDSYLLIKVNGWTDRLALSEKDKLLRWRDVEDRLTETEAWISYKKYISKLMRGKRVDFNPDTFRELVNVTAPYYLQSNKSKQELLKNRFWTPGKEGEILMDHLYNIDDIKNKELLTIDNNSWTIETLIEEIKTHPLVFRKQDIQKMDFAEQMKLAIVDLIRDKFITQDAYKSNFDSYPLVKRNISLWVDNLLALFQKFNILNSVEDKSINRMQVLEDVMNPYIRELQTKYSDTIEININEFADLKLSRIDMIALQPDMAYPFIVPLFPELTTLTQLDYGKRMSQ
jgi:sulfur transfer complex TusBCD TusB component (DsrH family)